MLKAVKAMPLSYHFASGGNLGENLAASQETNYADPQAMELRSNVAVRSYFPETWIWDLVPTGYL